MHIRRSIPYVVLALLILAALPAGRPAAAQSLQQEQVSKFQLAQSYLRSGQFERAITLLEDLHAQNPEVHVFYTNLKKAYENVKRYDEAVALVDAQLAKKKTPVFLAEKARLIYLRGDEKKAFETWEEAVALAPDQRGTYRVVYASLIDNRLFEKAIDILEAGRERLGSENAFQTNLARLYSLTGLYEKAIDEYLRLLKENGNKLSLVQSRLSRFSEKEEALRHFIAGTKQAVREEPLNRPYRELLSWLHMEAEQYAEALDAVRAIDRLEKEQGRSLYRFVQRAAHAGAYDVALEGYQEILDRYPDAPSAPQAQLGLGVMHEKWAKKQNERAYDGQGDRVTAPHYEKALTAYRTFLQEYPNHPSYPEVLRRMGRLQQDVFHNLSEAETSLRKVIRRFPDTPAARQARYDLGQVALLRGQLEEARLAFSRLEEELQTGELADMARYELALLDFYQGQFKSAQALASALNKNTSKDVANDAIELKVLLLENKGPDSLNAPLKKYARARLLKRQRRHQQALQTLDSLQQQHGRHPLADDTRFLRASTLQAAGRTQESLAAYLELPLIHPQSPLRDRSLFQAAQLQEQELDDPKAAIETYTRLLTDYPGSLHASDARARIRILRGDGV